MRAREPDRSGELDRAGVAIRFEVFGDGEPNLLLMPASPITHSREWKGQVTHFSRRARVIAYDGRGSGRSSRPSEPEAYTDAENIADAVAVMDACDADSCVLVTHCHSTRWACVLADRHPERVLGIAAIGPGVPYLTPPHPHGKDAMEHFEAEADSYSSWRLLNRHNWQRGGYPDWINFFFSEQLPEPHSSKQLEDTVSWALEPSVEVMLSSHEAGGVLPASADEAEALLRRLRCPILVIHGDLDQCQPVERGKRVAELTGGRLAVLTGSGHQPHARDPVRVNLLLEEFLSDVAGPARQLRNVAFTRALKRPRRALFISSPIGLGHIQRDLAIARELRSLVPELTVHWWAQHPVTKVLEQAGELIHPLSRDMALETKHWEEEAAGHELHAFYAFRRMDEILLANFMLFHDVVKAEPYDVWVGDESWEVDYYLHENPELKTAPYVFLTDVIGFLPVDPQGDAREVELTADYNAEMIAHRARYPYVRDLSLYIGAIEDLPDATFGPGLPHIREWAKEWFEPVGYVLPFDPRKYTDTAALRARLDYEEGAPHLFAAVGGTAVGRSLLHKVAEAFALVGRRQPQARLTMVTGPRIDPAQLPDVDGLAKLTYVHNLFEHLACADCAIVQGGLSTTMELVATKRPFIYFPLRKHWEQIHHVATRLDRYRAGMRLDYTATTPARLADEIEAALTRPVDYREVATGNARRVAKRIASLL